MGSAGLDIGIYDWILRGDIFTKIEKVDPVKL